MSGLAQLMAEAGMGDESEAFAGTCVACGRGMYKRDQGNVGRSQGWLMRATPYRCMTCYQRARKAEAATCITVEAEPATADRDELRREVASMRASGLSVRAICFRLNRPERVIARLLCEVRVTDRDPEEPSIYCAVCNRRMRLESEPRDWGVAVKARGMCVACHSRERRLLLKARACA